MAEILFTLHWAVRYLVLVAALVSLLLILASLRGGGLSAAARTAWRVYVAAIDIQVLIGVGVLLTRPFYPALMGHLVMMILALAAAHGFSIALRRRPPERQTPAFLLLGVCATVLLIVGGILAIGRSVI